MLQETTGEHWPEGIADQDGPLPPSPNPHPPKTTRFRSAESVREAQAALCEISLGGHDYQPQMALWQMTRGQPDAPRLPRWACTRCGTPRPPLTPAQQMANLRRFMDEEAANG